MEKILIILGFLLVRYLLSSNKKKKAKTRQQAAPQQQEETPQSLEDIFGDFVKDIKKDNSSEYGAKPKPASMKNDSHKASEDKKALDWQEVFKSKFDKPLPKTKSKYANYKSISNSDIDDSPMQDVAVVEQEIAKNQVELDLKQAVIAQTLLERKYFSI